MKKTILYKIIFFALISTIFFACSDTTNIGSSIIPSEDLIKTTINDTLEIKAYTIKIDSILTSSSEYAAVGSYIDPVFGSVQSSFITQTKIGVPTDFSNGAVLDSIVLYLRYKKTAPSVYGNTVNSHSLNIYEIDYNLSKDSIYYSNFNQDLIIRKNLLASTTFSYSNRENDSIIALKLSDDYGQRIINSYKTWSDITFNDYFNGIWIKSEDAPEDAAISLFDITSSETKVRLYYHNSAENSLKYDFLVNTSCLRMNLFNHNYDAGNILTDFSQPTQKEDSVVYVQGFEGVRTKIEIPGLDALKADGNWAISQAELIFSTVDDSYTFESTYPAPSSLSIFGISDDDKLVYLEQYLSTDSYLGISYSDKKYKFDITQRVQEILLGNAVNGFYIFTRNGFADPSRVVIGGTKNTNKIKLVLIATKI